MNFFKKYHRPYKIPLPRSQSAERAQPSGLARTPSLPSLSPADLSSQELFPAIISPKRKTDPPKENKLQGTIHRTDTAGSGFVLCGAGGSWGLPAPEGTKAVAQLGKSKKFKRIKSRKFQECSHGDHFCPVSWRPYQGRMEVLEYGLSD